MTFLKRFRYYTLRFLRSFFPIQLLIGHVKYNFFSLFFWFLLFSIASDNMGSSLGIPYLFYSPEYQGETNLFSFFLLGFALGGFIMAFHTYSYVIMCKKYAFLLTIPNSFIKFCVNNSALPLLFIFYFIFRFSKFQIREEFVTTNYLFFLIVFFILGLNVFFFFSFLYFFPKNRNIFKRFNSSNSEEGVFSFLKNKSVDFKFFNYNKNRRYIYFTHFFQWKISPKMEDFDKEEMNKAYRRTKISSSFFEFTTIICFFLIGVFREHPFLDLPAGMSIIMLFAIILMIYSALYSWFNYWTLPFILIAFIGMNYASKNSSWFRFKNFAYGLNYEESKLKTYDYKTIDSLNSDVVLYNRSKREYEKLMNQWKYKTKKRKPKLIIILTSGGGSRSALWTFSVLKTLDSTFNYKISKHTQMITGASGGMVGAAYYRELYLKFLYGEIENTYQDEFTNNISKDLLNKLSVSAYSNDFFFRAQSFKYNQIDYVKDRAYSFEEHLNSNTKGVLDKALSHYYLYERKGWIPTMIFTPTIVNDGRRMLISSQKLAFLCSGKGSASVLNSMNEYIDFQTYFQDNNQIRFLSVLRASATFPLVLPMVSFPTYPEINLMDAGIRDNYGVKLAFEYLFALKKWIKENTSGVIILKIRDTKKVLEGEKIGRVSLFEKFTLPFGNMYRNFTRTQDFDQDELMKIAAFSFNFPIDLVEFNLREKSKDRISLSWHLTSQEKNKIKNALNSKNNQNSIKQMKYLIQ
ncbi:MAG: patatin-like phospholipase family protein [Flavobacteriia bacterium]|nr:patatin-like phospholipase family protein [Flavobacteriia bacterium]